MTEAYIMNFVLNAVMVCLLLAGPVLLASLVIGSVISLFQAATQINEVTITFVPKIVGIGLVIALLGSWMGQQILTFTTQIFVNLPTMPR
jgi:flagellar biosynthesis protein FliQ